MILDSLALWRRYAHLNPRFAAGFAFLEQLSPDTAVGRHEIDGDAVYALVQRYRTRPLAGMQLESHRRYIDIQCVLGGRELIHWAPLAGLAEATRPYDVATDAALHPLAADMVPVPLKPGWFTILFPDDAHAPTCAWGEETEVVKVVVKVAV